MKDYTGTLHKAQFDYDVDVKNTDDIIDSCNFETDKDKLICKDIILHLHRTAAAYINNDKVVNIPYIGCLRKNPITKTLVSKASEMRELKKKVNISEYRFYVGDLVNETKKQAKEEDAKKQALAKYKSMNQKLYARLVKEKGIVTAIKFIQLIQHLEVVPFDEEVEEMYRRLNGEN